MRLTIKSLEKKGFERDRDLPELYINAIPYSITQDVNLLVSTLIIGLIIVFIVSIFINQYL